MRAILIDTYAKEVREVDFNGDYKHIYELLSDPNHKVDIYEAVRIDAKETIFVDEEGLLKEMDNPGEIAFFRWKGGHQALAGNGLILSTDEEGESVASELTLDFVRDHVIFLGNR
jgi:hypothetical protein